MKRALVAIALLTLLVLGSLPTGAQEYVSSRLRLPAGSTVGVGTGTATATSGGVLTTSTTQLCTTAVTTEETLWTYTLPANTLDTNGRGVRITSWDLTAATANTKTIKLYFGATVVAARTGGDNAVAQELTSVVWRTSATAQVSGGKFQHTNSSILTLTTPAETLANAIVIKMTGQNGTAAANDICFRGAVVEAL